MFPIKYCVVIAGPTAVGKTDIAIQLAKYLNTEIISADSRQCFHELNIGVAKPSLAELSVVTHYFINHLSVSQTFTAADYEKFALERNDDLISKYAKSIIVGGTGLYIKAFCEGLDPIPDIDETVRKNIIAKVKAEGVEWLQDTLRKKDPHFASTDAIHNPQRSMRALEVIDSTGKSILSFHNKTAIERPFKIIKICLEMSREDLYARINKRVDKMIADGLVEEAKQLSSYRHNNALQTVGYSELFEYFDGKISLDAAINLIKQNTRRYAKRQITWFKKQEGFKFLPPNIDEVVKFINSTL